MPELPEVETVRRSLWPQLRGRRFVGVEVREARLRWPVDATSLVGQLLGTTVVGMRRRGKYLLIDVRRTAADAAEGFAAPKEAVLLAHLGMTGWLGVVAGDRALRPHDHVVFALDDGRKLLFNDARRFGSLGCFAYHEEADHALLRHLGPEPLDEEKFSGTLLWRRARGVQRSIKSLLMDANVVVGVGNIYANEALFAAGVHPRLPARRLSKARAQILVAAVREVLRDAIEVGGTTLRDFTNADGLVGLFAPRLRVYGRENEPCWVCSRKLRKLVLHGRSTYLCDSCQKH